jgi:hypothetical protein
MKLFAWHFILLYFTISAAISCGVRIFGARPIILASGGQGGSFRENHPPGPPAKAFNKTNAFYKITQE